MSAGSTWGLLLWFAGLVLGWGARSLWNTNKTLLTWLSEFRPQRQCPVNQLHGPHQWNSGTDGKGLYECPGNEKEGK